MHRLFRILILQLPRGDFCNKIGQYQTLGAKRWGVPDGEQWLS